jgi:hypothetical protein
MTRVFIEMYFDEDVSDIAARSLRNRGNRVLTTQETRGSVRPTPSSLPMQHHKT